MAPRSPWVLLGIIASCGGAQETESEASGGTFDHSSGSSTSVRPDPTDGDDSDGTACGTAHVSLAVDPRGFLLAVGHDYWSSSGPGTGYNCWAWFERFDDHGIPVSFPSVTAQTDLFDCGVGAAFENDGTLHVAAALGMRRYPPDTGESDRTTLLQYSRAFVLREDASIISATQGPLSSSVAVLVEVDPRGQVTRTVEIAGLDGVIGLAETVEGELVLVGNGEVIAVGLDPAWDVRWTLEQGVHLERATAVARHHDEGVWLAGVGTEFAPGLLRVNDMGEVTGLTATDLGHTVVSIAQLSDGSVCTGGDRIEQPFVWQTACHNGDGGLRWQSQGPSASGSRALTSWGEADTAANTFAWTRLQAMPNGDLVALVPEQGITRFTPQGAILWIAPTRDAKGPDRSGD